jgi:hypothetical protein
LSKNIREKALTATQPSNINFLNLPPEIQQHILSYLPHEDRLRCKLVNKIFYASIDIMLCWKEENLIELKEKINQKCKELNNCKKFELHDLFNKSKLETILFASSILICKVVYIASRLLSLPFEKIGLINKGTLTINPCPRLYHFLQYIYTPSAIDVQKNNIARQSSLEQAIASIILEKRLDKIHRLLASRHLYLKDNVDYEPANMPSHWDHYKADIEAILKQAIFPPAMLTKDIFDNTNKLEHTDYCFIISRDVQLFL